MTDLSVRMPPEWHPQAWLWIGFTVVAALSQTFRNAMQRSLTARLGTVGATLLWNNWPDLVDLMAKYQISENIAATANLNNAFDKKYSPFAGFSTFQSDYFYYPADGRTFLMTASYNFR